MHELAITQSILDIARKAADEHGAKQVKSVRIMLGEYSGVVPQCIQYYFDVISKDTIAEGAVLDIQPNPDSLLRVFMAYYPSDEAVEIEAQEFTSFERVGFTVVEWGGCEQKKN